MNAQRLRRSLALAEGAGLVMLLRSVAFDRWISVLAAVALLAGVAAARRDKTWGIALAFASAAAFPTFVLLGIAPPWFMLVGALGMLPFVVASRAFARFDKGATVLLGTIAASLGALVAFGWKAGAPMLFDASPLLRPSYLPQHGLLLAALAGAAAVVAIARGRKRSATAATGPRVRIGDQVRVATAPEAALAYAEEVDVGDDEVEEARLARPRSQPKTNASATTRETSSQAPMRDHASGS